MNAWNPETDDERAEIEAERQADELAHADDDGWETARAETRYERAYLGWV